MGLAQGPHCCGAGREEPLPPGAGVQALDAQLAAQADSAGGRQGRAGVDTLCASSRR